MKAAVKKLLHGLLDALGALLAALAAYALLFLCLVCLFLLLDAIGIQWLPAQN